MFLKNKQKSTKKKHLHHAKRFFKDTAKLYFINDLSSQENQMKISKCNFCNYSNMSAFIFYRNKRVKIYKKIKNLHSRGSKHSA